MKEQLRDELAAVAEAEDPVLARMGAFSDAVFGFAITLLILAIHIPLPGDAEAHRGLLPLLIEQWRSFLAVFISFMLIGINWTNHRVMLSTFSRANHTLIWLNVLYLLLGVAIMPIPTGVLGAWLGHPHDEVVAAVFYGLACALGGLAYSAVWWYGAYIAKLTSPKLSAGEIRAHTLAWAPAPLVALVLSAVALVWPALAVAGFVLLILVYVLPLPRLISLKQQRHRSTTGD